MDIDAQAKHIQRLVDFEAWARPLLEEFLALKEMAAADIKALVEPEEPNTQADDGVQEAGAASAPQPNADAEQADNPVDPAPTAEETASEANPSEEEDHVNEMTVDESAVSQTDQQSESAPAT